MPPLPSFVRDSSGSWCLDSPRWDNGGLHDQPHVLLQQNRTSRLGPDRTIPSPRDKVPSPKPGLEAAIAGFGGTTYDLRFGPARPCRHVTWVHVNERSSHSCHD